MLNSFEDPDARVRLFVEAFDAAAEILSTSHCRFF